MDIRDDLSDLAGKDQTARKVIVYSFLALLSLNAGLIYLGGQLTINKKTTKFANIDNRIDSVIGRIEAVRQEYVSKPDLTNMFADLNRDRQRNLSSFNDHFNRIDAFLNALDNKLDQIDDKYEAQMRDLYMQALDRANPANNPRAK